MTEKTMVLPKESYDGKEIIDAQGRKITLRKPTMLDLYNLNKACRQPDGKVDEVLKNMATLLCFIEKIDGQSQTHMTNINEVLFALGKFRHDDFDLISNALDKEQEGTQEEIKK